MRARCSCCDGCCEGREVEPRLRELAERPRFEISASACWALTWRGVEPHRALLERAVARWPEDGKGWAAREVRRVLEEGDEPADEEGA